VVAVSAPGPSDTVTDGVDGLLTPEDPVDFAEAVRRMLTDDVRRREMGGHARETARTYSILGTARRLVSIYEQVRQDRLAARVGGAQ
jgi:D-inositol-3-phosphate glycosyltransferase